MRYLLDSNVFIYFLQGREDVLSFLSDLCVDEFYVSVVSRFEVLIGADNEKQSMMEVKEYFSDCVMVSFDSEIADLALGIANEGVKMKFKDLLIAATAIAGGYVLVTADKGFKKVKGLELCLFEV